MKAIHNNRYNGKIVFERRGKTITMTGHHFLRWSYPNVYDKAYEKYVESALIDAELAGNQILTQEEFESVLFATKDEDSFYSNALYKLFGKHIYSDTKTIDMIDPSGGPYINVGSNLKMFFGKDCDDLIVKSIKMGKGTIKFKIK